MLFSRGFFSFLLLCLLLFLIYSVCVILEKQVEPLRFIKLKALN